MVLVQEAPPPENFKKFLKNLDKLFRVTIFTHMVIFATEGMGAAKRQVPLILSPPPPPPGVGDPGP